jgi:hypothetical protein
VCKCVLPPDVNPIAVDKHIKKLIVYFKGGNVVEPHLKILFVVPRSKHNPSML